MAATIGMLISLQDTNISMKAVKIPQVFNVKAIEVKRSVFRRIRDRLIVVSAQYKDREWIAYQARGLLYFIHWMLLLGLC